jgi:hypothetical protein
MKTFHEICLFANLIHDLLKEDKCQSKRLHKPFPQLVAPTEFRFVAILRSEHNLVEALP